MYFLISTSKGQKNFKVSALQRKTLRGSADRINSPLLV